MASPFIPISLHDAYLAHDKTHHHSRHRQILRKDFARIDLHSVKDLAGANAEEIFERLSFIKTADHHKTSKNYLYVIRMVIYYAKGARDVEKPKWSAWKGLLGRDG